LLETGEILPGGRLRCLAHHYEFDLATGQCLTSACPPLSIQRLDG
jgi:UDP-MurNAc hydroxylase